MASLLKRKRAPVDSPSTPKRTKSEDVKPVDLLKPTGWDAAFRPPTTMNGSTAKSANGQLASPEVEAMDFEELAAKKKNEVAKVEKKKKRKSRKSLTQENAWRFSAPIAGRMVNSEPVFSRDEKYFIVANRMSVLVYSTSTSLLTRSIDLTADMTNGNRIVTFCLSPTDEKHLWVACSTGIVFCVDWTRGTGAGSHWITSSIGCNYMTVASMESAGRRRDVVFTTEPRKTGDFRITANELPLPPLAPTTRTVYTSPYRIDYLRTAHEGSVLVGVSGNKILVGRLRNTDYDSVDKIRYEFRVFESIDAIKSLDLRVSNRTGVEAEGLKKANQLKKTPIVDLVVGDVRGVVFVHNDLMAKLFVQSEDGSRSKGVGIVPRKLHWHRQAVQTVKWSLDGNYVISGGSETVLVLWQLDTGKHQFLPHLSATIQNVVVSPTGTSYGIQLADNSAMILSTAELQPTMHISGIQTCVVESQESIESTVLRVEDEAWGEPLIQKTPAVLDPATPSRLLLGVGLNQNVRAKNPHVLSNPFLQTFDLSSGHNVYRQALTRTNITNVNTTPGAHRLSEPRISHIKISHDGHWLATLEEWTPPLRDLEFLNHQDSDLLLERELRREVYLKFWQHNEKDDIWELVSRIDNPHLVEKASSQAAAILDIAVDSSSQRFATIGQDNVVRTWTPKARKRDSVFVCGQDGKPLKNWTCDQSIHLCKYGLVAGATTSTTLPSTGCVAFSEDGSILAAAIGGASPMLYLLDPESGTIRLSNPDIFENGVYGMEFLGQDIIILSDKLSVYDVVADDMRLSINLKPSTLSTNQKREMMHLAVDPTSQTFAIALPQNLSGHPEPIQQSLLYTRSEVILFHQVHKEPLLSRIFESVITALITTTSSKGYIVLDANAQLHPLIPRGTQAITSLAQSTSALDLDFDSEDLGTEAAAGDLLRLIEDDEDINVDNSDAEDIENEEGYRPPTPSATNDSSNGDDENEVPVVTVQQLASVFDVGPSFAMPSMEDMFMQVVGMFAPKPLVKREVLA